MTRAHHADVVIVGSGMGGGTLAWALRDSGAKVLILERGGFLPSEPQNWSAADVFILRHWTSDPDNYCAQTNQSQDHHIQSHCRISLFLTC